MPIAPVITYQLSIIFADGQRYSLEINTKGCIGAGKVNGVSLDPCNIYGLLLERSDYKVGASSLRKYAVDPQTGLKNEYEFDKFITVEPSHGEVLVGRILGKQLIELCCPLGVEYGTPDKPSVQPQSVPQTVPTDPSDARTIIEKALTLKRSPTLTSIGGKNSPQGIRKSVIDPRKFDLSKSFVDIWEEKPTRHNLGSVTINNPTR